MSDPWSVPREQQQLIVAAEVEMREYGYADAEWVIRRAGLPRVEGFRLLADLERRGLVSRAGAEVSTTFSGRMMVGLLR